MEVNYRLELIFHATTYETADELTSYKWQTITIRYYHVPVGLINNGIKGINISRNNRWFHVKQTSRTK